MHKINGFIAILFWTAGMFSCKMPGRRIERFKDGTIAIVYEYPDKKDTTTYKYLENYPNGQIHKQFSVQHNLIIGNPTMYYPSGAIYQIDSAFQQRDVYSSVWDGITKRYYKNGALLAELPVKKGVIEGLAKTFNEKGVLLKNYFLIQDSIKDGPYTEFYPDGTISVKATFKNGLLDGMMYYFNEKGDTVKYYNRSNGDIDMPYKKWLDNGTTLYGVYADKSEKAVIWKWYDKGGKLIKQEKRSAKNGGFAAPE